MAQEHDQFQNGEEVASGTARAPALRVRWRGPVIVVGAILFIAAGAAWLSRKEIADNLIEQQLDAMNLPARYDIVSIGPSEQVIRNLSIGDPADPDLTVAELRISTRLYWGLPGIGRITVVRPRLYGKFYRGKLSFGSLDKVLFRGPSGPFTMPDLDLGIVDGRALIDSDLGRVGVKLAGKGALRGGFSGEVAALAPTIAVGGCTAGRTTLYGKLTIASARPRFVGPIRTQGLACPDRNARLAQAGVQLDLTLDEALDGGEGKAGLSAGNGRYGANTVAGLSASGRFTYRKRALSSTYKIAARRVSTPQTSMDSLGFDGWVRSTGGLARFDVEGDLKGSNVALGPQIDRALSRAQRAGVGTLIDPIMAKMRTALHRESRGSSIDANVLVRRSQGRLSLVVTRGALRGGSGASLLSLSRIQALFAGKGEDEPPHVTGNFTTGGRDLPKIWGRMETAPGGRLTMQIAMPDYRAGSALIGVPRLSLTQDRDGTLGFTGQVLLGGAVPGGSARNLLVPVDGKWSGNGKLAVWRDCVDVRFDELQFANLTIDKRALTICPSRGAAIVEGTSEEVSFGAGATSLTLAGKLGQTPIRIASGPVGFASGRGRPGALRASDVRVSLGPAQTASRFSINRIAARVGKDITGTFDEADIALAAVPLDMKQVSGDWRYAGGVLSIDKARFTLVDRQPVSRFQPLVARDASLRLADNRIVANALLREPSSDRQVVRTAITHNLANATGHADLVVEGIVFDERLQADTLSRSMLGVVSGLKGQVKGTGRIDWTPDAVTSRGRFSTDGVDFAAAFGPVKGLSGEVVFTDLLGLVTAPKQTVHIASANPGIEVTDGTLSYAMLPGYRLQINGAQWPFMDGTLNLDPARMQIGVAETRQYTLRVTGLDAATFIQHLELENISATGTFDGEMPLIFDENGGRIEHGFLLSRPPGGNVAYNGALTYKDLSAMGNFAFDALKSVNYKHMEIGLGGSLSGEILTRISFDGLSQGKGASKNFITKQIAKLPIRFVLNIKAPFFSLFGSMRSLYDPNFVTDPREIGLLDSNGRRRESGPDATVIPSAPPPVSIQPPVSEKR